MHFVINIFDIGKGLRDEFPGFKLMYDDKELSNNVMILKGGFFNASKKDIGEMDKSMSIQTVLPKGCIVKDVSINLGAKDLVVESSIYEDGKGDQNIIKFSIVDIFKTNEFFEYSAIVEMPIDLDDLSYEQIEFNHRIINTNIKNIYIGPEKKFKVSFFSNGLSLIVSNFKASLFSLATTMIVETMIMILIIKNGLFDILGIILLSYSVFLIISCIVAYTNILLKARKINYITKVLSRNNKK